MKVELSEVAARVSDAGPVFETDCRCYMTGERTYCELRRGWFRVRNAGQRADGIRRALLGAVLRVPRQGRVRSVGTKRRSVVGFAHRGAVLLRSDEDRPDSKGADESREGRSSKGEGRGAGGKQALGEARAGALLARHGQPAGARGSPRRRETV